MGMFLIYEYNELLHILYTFASPKYSNAVLLRQMVQGEELLDIESSVMHGFSELADLAVYHI